MKIIGIQSIADLFGVSHQTIANWQDQGLPVARRGGNGAPSEYESDECIRWMVERELSRVQPETPSNRLALAKAQAVEMDNAERRGQLVRADQLEPKLKAAFVDAREKWLETQHRLARELPLDVEGREAMLRAEFEAFLIMLSGWPNAHEIETDAD